MCVETKRNGKRASRKSLEKDRDGSRQSIQLPTTYISLIFRLLLLFSNFADVSGAVTAEKAPVIGLSPVTGDRFDVLFLSTVM